MISFRCRCGKALKVKDELRGKKGKCPGCNQPITIPGADSETTAGLETRAPDGPPAETATYDFLRPAQAADEIGRLGPYRVLEVLGAGGMGVVFRAEDPDLRRLVALKAMLPALANNATSKERFFREARAAAALKHPNIVTIHQVGEDQGAPYLAMEHLEGESLNDRVKRQPRLPIAETLRIGREIARGLAAAHAKGLIHRDIKPANIWLEGSDGHVKILDFGLARMAQDQVQLTQSGAIVGTPAYMAPEQARSAPLDPRCDLFSLGCVLYRLCTGELPFKGSDTLSILMALAADTPTEPVRSRPEVPVALSDLIMRLLAKEPADRPESAAAVAEALDKIAATPTGIRTATRSPRSTAKGDSAPTARKRSGRPEPRLLLPWLIGSGVAALLMVIAAIAVVAQFGSIPVAAGKKGPDPREVEIKPDDGVAEKTSPPPKSESGPPKLSKFTNTVGMVFVEIPAGKFLMGSSPEEIERCIQYPAKPLVRPEWDLTQFRGEGPQHEVEITKPFHLGRTEVTIGQYRRFVEEGKYTAADHLSLKPGYECTDDFPVSQVSWVDAAAFCAWLSAKEGKRYRLPTEAEWEYACRAGSKGRYCFGDDEAEIPQYGWFGKPDDHPHPVAQLKPNAWGLYDMHGNVNEWCQDVMNPTFYAQSPKKDPVFDLPVQKEQQPRAFRGGGFWWDPRAIRSAFRGYTYTQVAAGDIGFRVLLEIPAR